MVKLFDHLGDDRIASYAVSLGKRKDLNDQTSSENVRNIQYEVQILYTL